MLDIKEEELKTILPLDGPSTEELKKYLEKYNDEYIVIKCGGSVLIDQNLFDIFIKDISTLNKLGFTPIIVHGGGKRISNKLNEIGLESKFIKGLRVTDKETIKVVEEVLIDFNKEIINALDQQNCKSQSINSKENNILTVIQENEELGFVGSPTNVDQSIIDKIIADKKVPIIAPLGLDKNPELISMYFGNYEKLVYQSQSSDNNLVELAEAHAEKLNLNFEHRHTGFGDLEKFVKKLA